MKCGQFDHRKKSIAFMVIVLFLLYIAYAFSFRHTIAAIRLNHQLKKEQDNGQTGGLVFDQINQKNAFYLQVLKGYRIRKEDQQNNSWMVVSNISLAHHLAISYEPVLALATDTLLTKQGVVAQQFKLKGDYFDIVKFLDSISKTRQIGKIAELKLSSKKGPQEESNPSKLNLQLTLVGIAK